ELLRHHEALAVVKRDAGEDHALRRVAGERPGGVARENVDLARLQRGEPLLRAGRLELHFVGVAEDGGGDGAANVDVDTGPAALAVGDGEAGEARVDSANQRAALLDGVEVLAGQGRTRGENGGNGRRGRDCELFHVSPMLLCVLSGTGERRPGGPVVEAAL